MGYRTTETVSERISERADGETYVPILPSTLGEWARTAKMLEANLAQVEGLLTDHKGQVAQLETENEQLRVELNNLKLVRLVEMRESGQITRKQFDDCVKALGGE